jgi:DNA-binding transcriptional regulator YbjK
VDGARGAATANKQYQNQTSTAVRANSLSHIAANSQDDSRFDLETKIGLETFQQEDEYKGSSPEVRERRDREYVTSAWATRLQSMAKNDPMRARELLEANKDKLDGGKVLQLQDSINQQIINVDTRVSSDKIIQSGALIDPSLKEAIKKFEGYKETPYKDFKQTSSGYGTKAQPGDENIPPEQRKGYI